MNADAKYTIEIHWTKKALFRWMVKYELHSKQTHLAAIVLAGVMWLAFYADPLDREAVGHVSATIVEVCAILIILAVGLLFGVLSVYFKVYRELPPRWFRKRTFHFSPAVVYVERERVKSEIDWWYFRKVTTGPRACRFKMPGRTDDLIIPRIYFPDDTRWDEFCAFCRDHHAKAKPPNHA